MKLARKLLRSKVSRVFQNPFLCLATVIFCFLCLCRCPALKQDFFLASASLPIQEEKIFLEQKDGVVIDFPQRAIGENSFCQSAPAALVKTEVFASLGEENTLAKRKEIIEYSVQSGETLSFLAEKFNISIETITWANDLTVKSKINPGQKLIILPVSGLMHMVENGESLSYLAQTFKVEMKEIIEFNELPESGEIFLGDLLIIPGGKMPPKQTVYSAPLASSYFIRPVPADFCVSQGLHWYNAIDFSNGKCGSPVFASAGGTVQKTGYDYSLAGNYVRLLHPNGVVTFYGHLSAILAQPGQKVSQGEIIGYVGHTGYTIGPTGCHLHFEVRGAKNPFNR